MDEYQRQVQQLQQQMLQQQMLQQQMLQHQLYQQPVLSQQSAPMPHPDAQFPYMPNPLLSNGFGLPMAASGFPGFSAFPVYHGMPIQHSMFLQQPGTAMPIDLKDGKEVARNVVTQKSTPPNLAENAAKPKLLVKEDKEVEMQKVQEELPNHATQPVEQDKTVVMQKMMNKPKHTAQEKDNSDDKDNNEDHDDDYEAETSVKAFIKSLKGKKRNTAKPKKSRKAESSDTSSNESSDEDRLVRKKKFRKVSIETEEEDEEEEDCDDVEEEEEDEEDKKKNYNRKKQSKVASAKKSKAGRRRGSKNKKPTKAEIAQALKEANRKIAVLEAQLKRNEGDVITISDDSDTGVNESASDCQPIACSLADVALPADNDPVWQIPVDDYGFVEEDGKIDDVPFLSINNCMETGEESGLFCKACLVEKPLYLIRDCDHFGLCEDCEEKFNFSLDKRCPGCGITHFILCKRVFS
ncbi:hypothetical protein ONE63_011612 [Megalurothrips usitatus]|uniref:Uncharacterized protein n=1 Tax=Megalurothrips usitatus TaxID=439358 RepID=A0AAV7X536_9NEOP|nr:hypothetical protein ONE63_011612 [Megalurothrips usitatus]